MNTARSTKWNVHRLGKFTFDGDCARAQRKIEERLGRSLREGFVTKHTESEFVFKEPKGPSYSPADRKVLTGDGTDFPEPPE